MIDLKVINSVIEQMEAEKGIPRAKMIDAIESALATAYKKEYGKRGQVIRSKIDLSTGTMQFEQVKTVVDKDAVVIREEKEDKEAEERFRHSRRPEEEKIEEVNEKGEKITYYNPEHHIFLEDAKRIKRDAKVGDEIVFPLEEKSDYGRIAAQTAKQVIVQKIREAERVSVFNEYGEKEGSIVSGAVQRMERGNLYVDMGRATAILPYEEQIPGERYKPGERIRAYLYRVEETPRGIFLRLSRSHPKFLEELFKSESPELGSGTVEVKAVAREAGSRSKIAVASNDGHIDPVGSLVGQRGVRVSTVMSELAGEKIDIIEWSADPKKFIEEALSPARIISITTDETDKKATVEVSEDQQSLAIGKGGQNVRLAAKLTGWKIDIVSSGGEFVEGSENPDGSADDGEME
ncbi:MAG: transcription termination/antitermination protein NusA [Patescibacteria group bacterium]|nr:transcription termination/antitermination protein NusA [Patescibacteria group bacterium]MDE1945772.1 transcription termination/antitermination protein NusA [Patescibacteria group bacterium]